MDNPNWQQIREKFENEMAQKLAGLPSHKETPEELREFRSIISHELPELTPLKDFQILIKLLISGDNDLLLANKILNKNLKREARLLLRNLKLIDKLKPLSLNWIKENLPEEKLQQSWKDHETWLPRRFTIYRNKNTDFQTIASDTLVRYGIFLRSHFSTKL